MRPGGAVAPWCSSPPPDLIGEETAPGPAPNPAVAGTDGRQVLSRVGVADHELTPKAACQVPADVNTATPGSGEATHISTGMPPGRGVVLQPGTGSPGLRRVRPALNRTRSV